MNNLNKDIRDIFFENVKNNFLRNKKSYILTNDADVFALKKIRNKVNALMDNILQTNIKIIDSYS
jgi:Asp/Glu/hydantoin racemase